MPRIPVVITEGPPGFLHPARKSNTSKGEHADRTSMVRHRPASPPTGVPPVAVGSLCCPGAAGNQPIRVLAGHRDIDDVTGRLPCPVGQHPRTHRRVRVTRVIGTLVALTVQMHAPCAGRAERRHRPDAIITSAHTGCRTPHGRSTADPSGSRPAGPPAPGKPSRPGIRSTTPSCHLQAGPRCPPGRMGRPSPNREGEAPPRTARP